MKKTESKPSCKTFCVHVYEENPDSFMAGEVEHPVE
jgi:hypothetical protein